MAQHDYVIANGTGAAVRSDLNNALAAIVSQNSGATEPATMYAYQWWADTSTGLLKLRNAANNAWITLRELDGTLTIEAGTVSAPGLAFASDLNTGIYSPSADQLAIATNGVERVEWGTSEVVFNDGGTNYDFRIEGDTVDSLFFVDASTDRVGLGTSSPQTLLHLQATTKPSITLTENTGYGDNALGVVFAQLNFASADGSAAVATRTSIESVFSDVFGASASLTFSTSATGAAAPVERMRIGNDGNVYFGKTTTATATVGIAFQPSIGYGSFTRGSGASLAVNRQTDDGDLVQFLQADNLEGTISVSGTTVSYNGAHLSRWSQLPGGAVREEILRGTVLSNIDEMCAWGEENNEQLNRMKVSDVEGDPNVSGVFQAWDDDDDTYIDDFYCAMTGDFIIRIAEGTPVHRGQLLMSAGDGTAKPQDDDIIRSKTVAKVTSNHVTCTYDDGSYCVPCVLMTC